MTLLASCVWKNIGIVDKTICAYRAEKVVLDGDMWCVYDHTLDVIISTSHVKELQQTPKIFATPGV